MIYKGWMFILLISPCWSLASYKGKSAWISLVTDEIVWSWVTVRRVLRVRIGDRDPWVLWVRMCGIEWLLDVSIAGVDRWPWHVSVTGVETWPTYVSVAGEEMWLLHVSVAGAETWPWQVSVAGAELWPLHVSVADADADADKDTWPSHVSVADADVDTDTWLLRVRKWIV